MSLHSSLADAVEGLPEDGAVTLPVGWLREQLDAEPEDEDELADLTVDEIAEELDRAPSTVRGWLGRGEIPEAYRLQGREWRVPRSALRRYLDRQGAERGEKLRRNVRGRSSADLGAWRKVRSNGDD